LRPDANMPLQSAAATQRRKAVTGIVRKQDDAESHDR
jgi:hypothetical protein